MNLKYLDSSDVESHDEEEGDYEIEEEKEQEIRGNCILEMIEHNKTLQSFLHLCCLSYSTFVKF